TGASVLSASRLAPLAPFPLPSPCRFISAAARLQFHLLERRRDYLDDLLGVRPAQEGAMAPSVLIPSSLRYRARVASERRQVAAACLQSWPRRKRPTYLAGESRSKKAMSLPHCRYAGQEEEIDRLQRTD